MAATVPTREPTQITAGDTVQWTRTDLSGDYSAADGWALTYYIVGAVNLSVTATADGTGFDVTISATSSATLTTGDYALTGRVSKDGEVFTVYSGRLNVLPNLATAEAGSETRSYWRKYRDDIRAALAVYGTDGTQAYTIMGERAVTLRTLDDWHKALALAESMVSAEEAAAGRGGGKNILMRFRNAR